MGIQAQFYLDSASFHSIESSKSSSLLDFFVSLKQSCLSKLKDLGLKGEAFGVVSALVFGDKDFLDKEVYNSYGAAGATHVLAVSGLHVGLIYLVLIKVFSFLNKTKTGRILATILILLGLWSYAAITGFSPSVLRASTMFSAILISRQLNRNSSIFNTLAGSAFLLLFIWPNLLMEVGFQLSYSAVLGILIIQPWLYGKILLNNWILDKAWQLTSVSIAAQIGTFPLGMLYFHQFPNYFILSNLFVIPIATFILYFTFFILSISWISALAEFCTSMLKVTVELLNFSVKQIERLPYSISSQIDISVLEAFMLYIIIGLSIAVFKSYKMKLSKLLLGILTGFIGLQCYETYKQSDQNFMLVHSLRNERAISILEGENAYLLGSKQFLNDPEKIQFHISHFYDKYGISNFEKISLNENPVGNRSFSIKNNVLFYKDYKIGLGYLDSHFYENLTHSFFYSSTDEQTSVNLILDGKNQKFRGKAKNTSITNAAVYAVFMD